MGCYVHQQLLRLFPHENLWPTSPLEDLLSDLQEPGSIIFDPMDGLSETPRRVKRCSYYGVLGCLLHVPVLNCAVVTKLACSTRRIHFPTVTWDIPGTTRIQHLGANILQGGSWILRARFPKRSGSPRGHDRAEACHPRLARSSDRARANMAPRNFSWPLS